MKNIKFLWILLLSVLVARMEGWRSIGSYTRLPRHMAVRRNPPAIGRQAEAIVKLQKQLDQGRAKDEKVEFFGEPYWKRGEYAFHRDITKKKVQKDTTTAKGAKTAKTAKTKKGAKTTTAGTTQTKYRPRFCGNVNCLKMYERGGAICGQRFDERKWIYELKEFKNLCELLQQNCQVAHEHWNIVRFGTCGETTEFSGSGSVVGDLMDSAKGHINKGMRLVQTRTIAVRATLPTKKTAKTTTITTTTKASGR